LLKKEIGNMSKTEHMKKTQTTVKVSYLTKILKASEDFLRVILHGRTDAVLMIKDLRTILRPYEKLEAARFLELLKQLLKDHEAIRLSILFGETDIRSVSLEKVKKLISNEDLEVKDLLFIAAKRFEMPIGVLRKMKKELIRQKILTTIQNIEKLGTIKKMASE